MAEKKRIVIAEDQRILREGLRSILSSNDAIEIVGEAEDGLEAIRAVEKCNPDLLLLDIGMPRMSGLSAIKEIKNRFQGIKILALTIHESDEYVLEAFQAGHLNQPTHSCGPLLVRHTVDGRIEVDVLQRRQVVVQREFL